MSRKWANSIRLSSIAHATEDVDRVVESIRRTCPADFPTKVQISKVKGHFGNEIAVCTLQVAGYGKAELFLSHLLEKLTDADKSRIFRSAEASADQSQILHLRLDKQDAFTGVFRIHDVDPVKIEIVFRGHAGSKEETASVFDKIRALK